ncbi:MAG TPA: hypothetical protein VGF16_16685 [Bryobacteraceae bacterium]|jgi:hypothetical protein
MEPSKVRELCRQLLTIPHYPRDEHDLVMESILEFADREDGLAWLVKAAKIAMTKANGGWAGEGELRGLWCTRFKPADRVEADCTLPGHTPNEIESANVRAHNALLQSERKAPRLSPAQPRKALAAPQPSPAGPLGDLITGTAGAKKLEAEDNYEPPDWLKDLA